MFPMIGSLLSSVAGGAMSLFGASQQNSANAGMVNQQEDFQREMRSTAYQTASNDMKAAGLNPMMMFGSGAAASTPSGAIAPMTSGWQGAGQAAKDAISTALGAKIQDATVDKMTEEIANLKVMQNKIQAEADLANSGVAVRNQQSANVAADTALKGAALHVATNEALKADNQKEFRATPAGKLLDQTGMTGKNISDTLSPVSELVSSAVGARRLFSDRFYFH